MECISSYKEVEAPGIIPSVYSGVRIAPVETGGHVPSYVV